MNNVCVNFFSQDENHLAETRFTTILYNTKFKKQDKEVKTILKQLQKLIASAVARDSYVKDMETNSRSAQIFINWNVLDQQRDTKWSPTTAKHTSRNITFVLPIKPPPGMETGNWRAIRLSCN